MKKIIYLLITVFSFSLMSMSSCVHDTSDRLLNVKQEKLMQEANAQIGMPAVSNFTQRKMMKMIIELCDQENLICYAYIVPEMTGKPVFLGKCIGYGLPYATQYTNPMKTVKGMSAGEFITIPQADPNGLFMPASAEGTWILLINPKTNEPHPVYCESRVLISPFEL